MTKYPIPSITMHNCTHCSGYWVLQSFAADQNNWYRFVMSQHCLTSFWRLANNISWDSSLPTDATVCNAYKNTSPKCSMHGHSISPSALQNQPQMCAWSFPRKLCIEWGSGQCLEEYHYPEFIPTAGHHYALSNCQLISRSIAKALSIFNNEM